jgi:hypothetical protein
MDMFNETVYDQELGTTATDFFDDMYSQHDILFWLIPSGLILFMAVYAIMVAQRKENVTVGGVAY